jgi:hypothetical protein
VDAGEYVMAAGGYFAQEMEILRQRIAAPEQQGPEPSVQQPSVIAEAAEALTVALEELRTANDELQQQRGLCMSSCTGLRISAGST